VQLPRSQLLPLVLLLLLPLLLLGLAV